MKIVVRITKDTDGYFRAWCPAMPGCFAFGPSHDEARQNLDKAVRGYLASLNAIEPHRLEQSVMA